MKVSDAKRLSILAATEEPEGGWTEFRKQAQSALGKLISESSPRKFHQSPSSDTLFRRKSSLDTEISFRNGSFFYEESPTLVSSPRLHPSQEGNKTSILRLDGKTLESVNAKMSFSGKKREVLMHVHTDSLPTGSSSKKALLPTVVASSTMEDVVVPKPQEKTSTIGISVGVKRHKSPPNTDNTVRISEPLTNTEAFQRNSKSKQKTPQPPMHIQIHCHPPKYDAPLQPIDVHTTPTTTSNLKVDMVKPQLPKNFLLPDIFKKPEMAPVNDDHYLLSLDPEEGVKLRDVSPISHPHNETPTLSCTSLNGIIMAKIQGVHTANQVQATGSHLFRPFQEPSLVKSHSFPKEGYHENGKPKAKRKTKLRAGSLK